METERSELGLELETALNEVLSHVRGESTLPQAMAGNPASERIPTMRRRLKLGDSSDGHESDQD